MKLKHFALFGLVLSVTLVASACGAPAAAPTTAAVAQPTTAPLESSATPLPIPPTATNTRVPPTATHTASHTPTEPPTNTATATATNTATATLTSTPTNTVPPTATNIPPTATRPATARPTAVPTVAALLAVTWKTNMEYNPRDGNSNWCQMHNEYQNNDSEEALFVFSGEYPEAPKNVSTYAPVFGIANADGSINRWRQAGWYSTLFGWPNGIPGFPPPLAAGAPSGDWTWYSISQTNGEYCRFVYVRYKGHVSAAEYAPNGELINRNAILPEGAP